MGSCHHGYLSRTRCSFVHVSITLVYWFERMLWASKGHYGCKLFNNSADNIANEEGDSRRKLLRTTEGVLSENETAKTVSAGSFSSGSEMYPFPPSYYVLTEEELQVNGYPSKFAEGFISTCPPPPGCDFHGILSLDCEMCYTSEGLELMRVTLVDKEGKLILGPYHADDLNEPVLFTPSADVGKGYQCIRPVNNINVNVDAAPSDPKDKKHVATVQCLCSL